MDWYRIETWKAYERPQSEVTGNATDNYERRAPGTAGMDEGVRYQIYESKDGHVLFMASEQAFWKNFCEGVGRMDMFEKWPGSKYGDHARGNREMQSRVLRDIFKTRTSAEWLEFGNEREHTDRTGQHAEDDRRRPAVPGPLPVDPGVAPRRRRDADFRSSSSARSCRSRPGAEGRGAHRRRARDGARLRRRPDQGAARVGRPRGLTGVGRCLRGRRYSNSRVSRADRTRRPVARQARRGDAPPAARRDRRAAREHGLRDLRVVDIAREVGTSPATFYQYFRDVEEAVLALAEEVGEQTAPLGELLDAPWDGRRRARRRRASSSTAFLGVLGRPPRGPADPQPRGAGGRPAVPRRAQRVAAADHARAWRAKVAEAQRAGRSRPSSRPGRGRGARRDDGAHGRVPRRPRALRRRRAPTSSRPRRGSSSRR